MNNKEHKDQLSGGLADKKKPEDFNQTQLFLGTASELEHVDDPRIAMEIAMDHLVEDKDYYYKLHQVESAKSIHWKTSKSRKLARRDDFQGLKISIETDIGELRHWYDPHNKEEGTTKMQYPYGYIRNTMGADDEHVDVYIGPNKDSDKVFIIHQMKAPEFTEYDEDKVMLGFVTRREAKAAYLAHYNTEKFFGSMTQTDIEAFKRMFIGDTVKSLESMIMKYQDLDEDMQKGLLDKIKNLWNKIKSKFRKKKKKPTKVWIKTSHEKTCSTGVCNLLNGMEIPIDEEFPYIQELTGYSALGPPAHGSCYCTLIIKEPVKKNQDFIEGEDIVQKPQIPAFGMVPEPFDVDTLEGIQRLLNQIGTLKDNDLMNISTKIWGSCYDFEGQTPMQARSEILGFLLDQQDLLKGSLLVNVSQQQTEYIN